MAFRFPRNPRKSIYGEKYTKFCYPSFVFFATRSPSFIIPAKQYLRLTQQTMSEDDFAWAPCGGNAISNREVVQPHDNKMKKVDDQLSRKCLVRQGTSNATRAFLVNTYLLFNFPDMLCRSCCVDVDAWNMIMNFFKFVIHKDSRYCEARLSTHPYNS